MAGTAASTGRGHRADAQVKIQRAVEGLSIIAITYYLLNLFKTCWGWGCRRGMP